MKVSIAGHFYRDAIEREALRKAASKSWDVGLHPDPTNPHDPNAIQVLVFEPETGREYHVGFIPRDSTQLFHSNAETINPLCIEEKDGNYFFHYTLDNAPTSDQDQPEEPPDAA